MKFESGQENQPYKQPLEDTDFKDSLFDSKQIYSIGDLGDADHLVRIYPVDDGITVTSVGGVPVDQEEYLLRKRQYRISEYKEARKLYQELHDTYGINVIDNHLLIAEDPAGEGPSLHVVVDHVIGKDFSDEFSEEEKHELKGQIIELVKSLTQYATDRAEDGKPFLWDLYRRTQYKYGHLKGESVDRIYLVDVDSYFAENFDSEAPETASDAVDMFTLLQEDFDIDLSEYIQQMEVYC